MWLIVGYGNTLREDDGAGFHLATLLAAEVPPHLARVLAVHQLTPELALELAQQEVERVLFVDARRDQGKPLAVSRLAPLAAAGSCSHHLTPGALLYMAHSLYQRAPRGWLLTLAAQRMSVGDTLSEATKSAVSSACALVNKLLEADLSPSRQQK